MVSIGLASGGAARAQDAAPLSGEEIARRVNARDDGDLLSRTIVMELTDKRGTTRTRVTRSFRRRFDDGVRSILFFDEPANVQGTALLTWDYADPARTDDQWLYLPALRKSRRVALADRGRAFLGTDLSFEDMKKETRVGIEDYAWREAGEEQVDGRRCLVVEAIAVDARTAREIGYGRMRLRVDAETWIPRFLEYWAPDGAPLKTIRLREVEEIEGIWTARRVEAENLQTGHRTLLRFERIDYGADVAEDLFTEAALRRGAP
ncbi:MAG: hypothetical protein DCC71_06640 [Proteobacteria bacterium]|nr:MAG: hypothetical protein DCC71_06640 [Pseudomonadota bacterium]